MLSCRGQAPAPTGLIGCSEALPPANAGPDASARRKRAAWLVRGQVTAETAVVLTAVIAGLVFLAFYVQRAMQGSFFGTSQSIGLQFDPRDVYAENQSVGMTETVTQDVGWEMTAASILPTGEITDVVELHFHPAPHPKWVLESLPSGPVPREPAAQQAQSVIADWDANRSATYDDIH